MGRPRTYSLNENYFESINSINKAYIIGFLYADGGIYKNRLEINISDYDIEILDFIIKELEYTGNYKKFKTKDSYYYRLTITSKKLTNDLIKIGIIPNKTYNSKSFPKISKILIPHMIRGFFDGDGSIYSSKYKNRTKEFTVNFSSNEFILKELKEILLNNNISSGKIRFRRNSIYSGMLEIRGSNNIENFYKLIYNNDNNFYLKRKYNRFIEFKNISSTLRKNLNQETINNIQKLYINGKKQSDISKSLKLNYGTVRSVIQRLRKQSEMK